MNNSKEPNTIVYQQHCEWHRHQDKLKWNAFRMLTIVEGAVLLTLFKVTLTSWVQIIFMFSGFLIVLFLSLMTIKDQIDERAHLAHAIEFEKQLKPFIKPNWPNFLSGFNLVLSSLVLLNIFNFLLFFINLFGDLINHGSLEK